MTFDELLTAAHEEKRRAIFRGLNPTYLFLPPDAVKAFDSYVLTSPHLIIDKGLPHMTKTLLGMTIVPVPEEFKIAVGEATF